MRSHRTIAPIIGAGSLVLAFALTACSSTQAGAGAGITVTSTDTECTASAVTASAGVIEFTVVNSGTQVTEVYVLGADALQVEAELENVGPGISRSLVAQLEPGSYVISCKPGMSGDGIRTPFTVTGTASAPATGAADQRAVDAATQEYQAYVQDEAAALLKGTRAFTAAYRAGDDVGARALYAPTRMHWESIEPVAESFGDLDPILDAREADLAEGEVWTGWHRIEKDLWPPAAGYTALTTAQRDSLAAGLVRNTAALVERTASLNFTLDQLGNGAKELLDEVATSKITGEEETWSHTDLWDFKANLDGAHRMFTALRPIVEANDPALAAQLDAEFADVTALLARYRDGDGYVSYMALTPAQVKELAAAVDALGEPLAHLTSVSLLGRRASS
ncbi:MAG: imelysin family protein [Candidatus Nanopelagicales bacterium]|nr:imelysin family protein [Candidatus Nanopelagicales bacterium]